MAFNHEYPYVDPNMFNDDWLLNMMKQLLKEFENFINLNKIKYADPILWDITRQYEVNTIVIDPQTGDAYISTKAVPYGVSLSNTNYWTKIYNYANTINTLEEQIAAANEELSTTATAPRSVGDLVWLNGKLYQITSDMIAGDSYVVNSNCVKVTLEQLLGNLLNLNTEDKSNLVAAINEVLTTLAATTGDLDNLNTENKSNLVAAVNEVLTSFTETVGDLDNLNTTDKSNLVAAINSIVSDEEWYNIGNDYTTDLGAAINNAIGEGYRRIYIPAGTYIVDTTIRLNKNDLFIRGAGKESTILKTGSNNTSCVFISDTRDNESDIKDVTLMDFCIDGDSKSDPTVIKILFIAASNNSASHEIINPTLINLKLVNSNGCLVNFDGGGALNRTENYWIKNAYVFNCECYNSGVKDVIGGGIHFTHSVMGTVDHCTVDNSGQECYTFDNYCRYMTIKNCYVGNNNGGAGALSIDLCEGFVVDNCIFDSHWSVEPNALARCGIKINDEGGASRGCISNCKIFNNTNGIIVNAPLVADYGVEVVDIVNCVIGNLDGNGWDIISNVTGESRVSVRNTYGLFGNTVKMKTVLYTRSRFEDGYYRTKLTNIPATIGSTIPLTVYINDGFTINGVNGTVTIPTTGLYEVEYQCYAASDNTTMVLKANGNNYNQIIFPVGDSSNKALLEFTAGDVVTFEASGTGTANGFMFTISYCGNAGA